MAQAGFKGSKTRAGKAQGTLAGLRGIGPAMLKDFEVLGIRSVEHLALQDGQALYDRLGEIHGTRHDPCVLDTFRCAVAQARDPKLPDPQKNWWHWSRVRKAEERGRSSRLAR